MRAIWAAGGAVSLVLGFSGVALPLLPTVPFVLLAAYCFARSSRRLHDWLLTHRMFGPMIDDWNRNGAISRGAKRAATVSIAIVFAISVGYGLPWTLLLIQAVVLGGVLTFIWTRPTV